MDIISWEDVDIEDEEISEADIANAESSGKIPPLKFLGTCEESNAVEAKMPDYTGYKANLKWTIDEVLEVGTFNLDTDTNDFHPATEEEKNRYEGRFVFDDILLAHPSEADWAKNRRIIVAKRCGLMKPGDKITTKLFSSDIIGIQAIITTEGKKSKEGAKQPFYVNVAFDGYASVTDATEVDNFDDI